MSAAPRDDVVSALTVLAGSSWFQDRIDAARAVAPFIDLKGAAALAERLVLDDRDTAVTFAAAESLARRHDRLAWRVLASATGVADDDQWQWISDGVRDVVYIYETQRLEALAICQELALDHDPAVREGAAMLSGELVSTRTVLQPDPRWKPP